VSVLPEKKEKNSKNEASLAATDCRGCLFQLRANLEKESHPYEKRWV